MKIAVVGSGISGMGAALALSEAHDVTLFEASDRFGGHANTQMASFGEKRVPVDTGFIVYNYANYPNLTGLFEYLDIPTKWSDMSFGMSLKGGALEYAFDSLDKIFAQRSNIVSLGFWKLLKEIKRFNDTALTQLDRGELEGVSLGNWTAREGYSKWFRERFILPMGGAIWSTPVSEILDFPAKNFVTFFRNHDLMTGLDAAQRWRTVDGGSRIYVDRLIAKLGDRAVLNMPVTGVDRETGQPRLSFADGSSQVFDQVIMATHGPTTFALMSDKTDHEARILGGFRVSENKAVLHSDPSLMPKREKVWSSWNFLTDDTSDNPDRPAPVTYWMNRLQTIPKETPLFVSLNPIKSPREHLVHGTYFYDHPVFERDTFDLQKQLETVQGQGGIWYAGAWLGYGFHEDGLRSGLRVAASLGARPSWAGEEAVAFETGMKAAE